MKKIVLLTCMFVVCLSSSAQYDKLRNGEKRKLSKISSVIKINNLQKNSISEALQQRRTQLDAIDSTLTAKELAYKNYEIEKKYHEELISQLSNSQIAEYCSVAFAPEVEAKTDYRMSLLTEVDNEYTEEELTKIKKEIYNYLMLEKIVYFKYKYDYAKQKENISRLKAIQPRALKASINNEKQKGYGKVSMGRVNWQGNK